MVLIVVFLTFIQTPDSPADTRESGAFPCTKCDYLIDKQTFDGKQHEVKPGEVICLAPRLYDRITVRNISGSADNPIVIRNCGGKTTIYSTEAFGLKFENSNISS